MGVKFLSEEWTQQATDTLNSHEGFSGAVASIDMGLQFSVSDTPDGGDVDYTVSVGGGSAAISLGTLEGADVSISSNYETASGISAGDLNMQTAFMTGKIKVAGNLAKLMMHQAALGHMATALASMDIDY
jgi:putative sterol carrier protein